MYAYRDRSGSMVHLAASPGHRLCDLATDRQRTYIVTATYPAGRQLCPECQAIDSQLLPEQAAHMRHIRDHSGTAWQPD